MSSTAQDVGSAVLQQAAPGPAGDERQRGRSSAEVKCNRRADKDTQALARPPGSSTRIDRAGLPQRVARIEQARESAWSGPSPARDRMDHGAQDADQGEPRQRIRRERFQAHRHLGPATSTRRSYRRRTRPPGRASRMPRAEARAEHKDDRTASGPKSAQPVPSRSRWPWRRSSSWLSSTKQVQTSTYNHHEIGQEPQAESARQIASSTILGRNRRSMPKSPAVIRHPQRGREAAAAPARPARPRAPPPGRAGRTDGRATTRGRPDSCAGGPGAPVAAVRLDELEPRPVDDGRDQSRDASPIPRWRSSSSSATLADGRGARGPRSTRRSHPQIQPLYLNSCATPDGEPQPHGSSRIRTLEKPLPLADRQHPEQKKRCVGQGHPRERDVRARQCGERRGRAPCPAAECPAGQPGRRRGSSASRPRSRPESPRSRRLPSTRYEIARPGTETRAERRRSTVGSRSSKPRGEKTHSPASA